MNDKVKITLKSGKGGDGAIAFRHEKSIEKGGPYGGNGGKGGSIYLVADEGINSLANYRFGKTFFAQDGGNGLSKLCYGKDGKDVYLHVPIGTVVLDLDGNILYDLDSKDSTFLACKGGRGGRGNATFKSSTRRTPNVAENGMPGEEKTIYLELKLIADVGLVGFPNVGKSTILSTLTRAHPEIGDYPFTTITPSVGVCYLDVDKHFVLADIPGLIEGASSGKGLGYEFLRHIERCKILLHVIDIKNSKEPLNDFKVINEELKTYNSSLANRKMIICLNKADDKDLKEKAEEIKEKFENMNYPCFIISAKEEKGLKPLVKYLYKEVTLLNKNNEKVIENTSKKEVVYSARSLDNSKIPVYDIIKRDEHYYEIVGERVIRTKKLINIKTDEGLNKLLSYLDRIGVNDRLKEKGVKDGDTVLLDDFEFEYFE